MESLSSIVFFVQAAETRSYSTAGRNLGVSASAVGKSICRLETHLGVRLFHRSTRSMTLTAEGALFLERCRRILCELEAADLELSESQQAPSGKLRVSLPLVRELVMPALTGFMHRYPAIELEVDFSDRMVDVIEEGFDVVMRSGEPADSRLQSRLLGHFHLQLLATPQYLAQHGVPQQPLDLLQHACLQHRFPHNGKLEPWPLQGLDAQAMTSFLASLPTMRIPLKPASQTTPNPPPMPTQNQPLTPYELYHLCIAFFTNGTPQKVKAALKKYLNRALKARSSLMIWFEQDLQRHAPLCGKRGRNPSDSHAAIECSVTPKKFGGHVMQEPLKGRSSSPMCKQAY